MVGSGGNLGLSREYSKKLFGRMFYSWCNCPLGQAKNKFEHIFCRQIICFLKDRNDPSCRTS